MRPTGYIFSKEEVLRILSLSAGIESANTDSDSKGASHYTTKDNYAFLFGIDVLVTTLLLGYSTISKTKQK
jgi:hypothetical protein